MYLLLLLVGLAVASSIKAISPNGEINPKQCKRFQLEFQYACRAKVPLNLCKGNVFWNGRKIVSIHPKNYGVQTHTSFVAAKAGDNKLEFRGTTCKVWKGLTIDNVKLIRQGPDTDIVINGGFEEPNVEESFKIFDGIKGWQGKGIEVGNGKAYNEKWESQVVGLDGFNNTMSQQWNFD